MKLNHRNTFHIFVTILSLICLFGSILIIWLLAIPQQAEVEHENISYENKEMIKQEQRKLHYSELMGLYSNHKTNRTEFEARQPIATNEAPIVKVWIEEQKLVEKVNLEQYVLGVALQELPLSFQKEAIKAQMLAIRTYILRRLMQNEVEEAYHITNTTKHQVYKTVDEVEQLLNNETYALSLQNFIEALEETKGFIITYQEQPIDALFFSTSNGYTVDAKHYFGSEVPYLKAVKSEWDAVISPSYSHEKILTFEQVNDALHSYGINNVKATKKLALSNAQYSNSNRLLSVEINDKTITGRQLREALSLPSTDISWSIDSKNKEVIFYSKGYGHGVGLSQWGAEGMARAGYEAEDIISYYYTNVDIEHYDKLLAN